MSRAFPPESGTDGLSFLGRRSVLQSLSPLNSKHLRQLTKIPGDSRFGGAQCRVIVHGRALGGNQASQAVLTVITDLGEINREDGPDFLQFINYSLREAV